jgi:electron transfer flavoprotein alpha subunit
MAKKIWVVLQQRDGKLHRMSWEAVVAGQKLAELGGGEVAAVILGSGLEACAEELASTALASVHLVDNEALATYAPGPFIGALAAAIEGEKPDLVIFPHTYQSVDFVPRLAQTVGAALVPEVTGFESADGGLIFRRPIMAGKLEAQVRAKGEGTVVISVQSGAFSPDDLQSGSSSTQPLAVDLPDLSADREILGVEEVGGEQVDLSQSEVVVAVGRGIGGADNMGIIEELAGALGGEIGASRPVIDSGWLPRDRQIGSSGQTVAPKLYLAAGISGAIQHLVGMKGAKVIVAINKDSTAPIFGIAQYGIVGDLHEIVPALTAAIREAKAE